MNNKRVKGWQNVDKLYAEYKQVIQRSRIQCLNVQFTLVLKESVRQFFLIYWNIFPKFKKKKKSDSRGPINTICFWPMEV